MPKAKASGQMDEHDPHHVRKEAAAGLLLVLAAAFLLLLALFTLAKAVS